MPFTSVTFQPDCRQCASLRLLSEVGPAIWTRRTVLKRYRCQIRAASNGLKKKILGSKAHHQFFSAQRARFGKLIDLQSAPVVHLVTEKRANNTSA